MKQVGVMEMGNGDDEDGSNEPWGDGDDEDGSNKQWGDGDDGWRLGASGMAVTWDSRNK